MFTTHSVLVAIIPLARSYDDVFDYGKMVSIKLLLLIHMLWCERILSRETIFPWIVKGKEVVETLTVIPFEIWVLSPACRRCDKFWLSCKNILTAVINMTTRSIKSEMACPCVNQVEWLIFVIAKINLLYFLTRQPPVNWGDYPDQVTHQPAVTWLGLVSPERWDGYPDQVTHSPPLLLPLREQKDRHSRKHYLPPYLRGRYLFHSTDQPERHNNITVVIIPRNNLSQFQMIANSLVFLCANLLGLVSAIMAERTLRNAFLETKASLSVSLVLEESLKEQVNALTTY